MYEVKLNSSEKYFTLELEPLLYGEIEVIIFTLLKFLFLFLFFLFSVSAQPAFLFMGLLVS